MGNGTFHDDSRDQELMVRVRDGDRKAFELLYARYAHPLLNFFHRMCFDRVAAEDYLQETFLRVWRARQRYRPLAKVSTWLFQIARNLWLNERDKQRLRPFHSVAGGEEGRGVWSGVADRSGDVSPEARAVAGEVEAALAEAVASLSEKLRLVFVLGRYQGLPYAEISQILSIPVGTVKSRMALAEKQLRDRLAPYLES